MWHNLHDLDRMRSEAGSRAQGRDAKIVCEIPYRIGCVMFPEINAESCGDDRAMLLLVWAFFSSLCCCLLRLTTLICASHSELDLWTLVWQVPMASQSPINTWAYCIRRFLLHRFIASGANLYFYSVSSLQLKSAYYALLVTAAECGHT